MQGVIYSCMLEECTSNDGGQCTARVSISEEGKCNDIETQCYVDQEKSCPINLIEKADECLYCSTPTKKKSKVNPDTIATFVKHIKRTADELRMNPDSPIHQKALYGWIDEASKVMGDDK